MSTSSTTPGGGEEPFDAAEFARQTVRSIEYGDAVHGVLEERVTRLEEIIAARWPRGWLVRRRLAREIRASVATWADDYIPRGDFTARRLAAASDLADELDARQQRARAEGWPEPGTGQQPDGDDGPGEGFLP